MSRFSAHVCGANAHIVFDPDVQTPVYREVSAANVNDVRIAKPMPIEPGATYVFDFGYYDYGWWAQLDDAGCRIVTRFKASTPLVDKRSRAPVVEGSDILSDRIGFLPERQAKNRRNPMQVPVREIVVRARSGKPMRLLTNDLDASAQEIADLYKLRWDIELFFRLMEQTLRITKFLAIRKRGPHPDRRSADRLSSPERHPKALRRRTLSSPAHSTRSRQSHAQKSRRKTQNQSPKTTSRHPATLAELRRCMNRTAVGRARP